MKKITVQSAGGNTVGFMSGLLRRVTAKINDLFEVRNFCLPRIFFQPWFEGNPLQSVLVGCLAVCSVLAVLCQTQVLPSIVRFNSVLMVDSFLWPSLSHVEPREPMGSIMLTSDLNVDVSPMMKGASHLPDPYLWPWCNPRKKTCIGVVAQNFQKIGMANHARSYLDLEETAT